jgi:branched-chain amino acid aminotransferase
MSQRVSYFNGQFVPERDARMSIYDSGLLMGDIAFEVTRTVRQQPFRLEAHIKRLFHSLRELQIDPQIDPSELQSATLETVARNLATEPTDVDWNIIHNVSRGPSRAFAEAFEPSEFRPTVIISCYPLTEKLAALAVDYERGIDLVVPAQRSLPHNLLDSAIKSRSRLHYQLANLQAEKLSPGSTAALVDPEGFLTEGSSGNLFVVHDGRLATPLPRNLLPGVTRRLVLELAEQLQIPASETDLTPREAEQADEMFLTSTTVGILHARTFNRLEFGTGKIGPVTRRLQQALYKMVGLDFAAQARDYASRI